MLIQLRGSYVYSLRYINTVSLLDPVSYPGSKNVRGTKALALTFAHMHADGHAGVRARGVSKRHPQLWTAALLLPRLPNRAGPQHRQVGQPFWTPSGPPLDPLWTPNGPLAVPQ
eukprot:1140338-Pyramimonas_sp.AAC.1